ncbi:IS3 family transposase [Haemophilus haemolyticus]
MVKTGFTIENNLMLLSNSKNDPEYIHYYNHERIQFKLRELAL